MPKTPMITSFNDSPLGICGACPKCGTTLRNPRYGEKSPSQLQWKVQCRNCGAWVVVQNAVVLSRLGLIAPEKTKPLRRGIAAQPRKTSRGVKLSE